MNKKTRGKHNYHARKKTFSMHLLWKRNRTDTDWICFLLEHFPAEWKDDHTRTIETTDTFTFNGVNVRLYYEYRQRGIRAMPNYANDLKLAMIEKTNRIKRYEKGDY